MHFEFEIYATELPEYCIADCSASGDVTDNVVQWVKELKFSVNQSQARTCLQGYGAWDKDEIAAMSDEEVAEKILWLACCDFRDNGDDRIFCME